MEYCTDLFHFAFFCKALLQNVNFNSCLFYFYLHSVWTTSVLNALFIKMKFIELNVLLRFAEMHDTVALLGVNILDSAGQVTCKL